MKKILSIAVLILGMAAQSHGYTGTNALLQLNNYDNSDSSPTATSNGRYFVYTALGAVLMNYPDFDNAHPQYTNINVLFFGGPDAAHLSLIASIVSYDHANYTYGYFTTGDAGLFGDGTGNLYEVPSVALGGTVYMRQQAWLGEDPDFATARANSALTAEVDWLNPTAGGVFPFINFTALTGMPAVIFVPEPGTFALAGLGTMALLISRRRKQA